MSTTTADRLALLLRTKQWQRKELEKRYPSLDFDEVPFSAYRQLWMGRGYVRGLVGAWNAYGRSNTDADRDVLYDYSGHGRDIRLYNFAFEGMSGYGGYVQNFLLATVVTNTGDIIEQTETKITVTNISTTTNAYSVKLTKANYNNTGFYLRAEYSNPADTAFRFAFTSSSGSLVSFRTLNPNGVTYVEPIPDEEWAEVANIYLRILPGTTATIEQLPVYPGGLVSDGIDDYGQCVKGFALPDDYTVVAIRKIIQAVNAPFVSKTRDGANGAFVLESGYYCASYGAGNSTKGTPSLFTYLMKENYNGNPISAGNSGDTENDVFDLFKRNMEGSQYFLGALYDLRIYDHSLTAEELQAVKDEMMADYEAATGGGIADIHYVADWDGKDRSNEEDEPMRSRWTDKAAGKVIDLHNYAYAGMSGWGGYGQDFSAWTIVSGAPYQMDLVTVNAGTVHIQGTFSDGNNRAGLRLSKVQADIVERFFMQVSGLKEGQKICVRDETLSPGISYVVNTDGVEDIRFTTGTGGRGNLFIFVEITTGAEAVDVTIEQLPLYPGALVSDGIDDYILAEEALGEVGTVLIHWKNIGLPTGSYLYNTGSGNDAGRLYCWNAQDYIACGTPHMQMDGHPIMVYHRSPLVSTEPLYNSPGNNNCPIFRLIFIKEQLDAAQQEFLKWKVEKEYRDWCKANGYEYAVEEMSNN